MSKERVIEINITGKPGVGKSTIAYLLADFLAHTGFTTELNLLDGNVEYLEENLPERLESLQQRETKIIVNEAIVPCRECSNES